MFADWQLSWQRIRKVFVQTSIPLSIYDSSPIEKSRFGRVTVPKVNAGHFPPNSAHLEKVARSQSKHELFEEISIVGRVMVEHFQNSLHKQAEDHHERTHGEAMQTGNCFDNVEVGEKSATSGTVGLVSK